MEYQLPTNWPVWAVLVYLLIKDALPTISVLVAKMTGIIVPARASTKKLLLEQQNKALEHQAEIEEKRVDLREREVVAVEQIGKMLIVIDTRLQALDRKSDLLTTGLVTANQALAVMLDRVHRRREDFETKAPSVVLGNSAMEE